MGLIVSLRTWAIYGFRPSILALCLLVYAASVVCGSIGVIGTGPLLGVPQFIGCIPVARKRPRKCPPANTGILIVLFLGMALAFSANILFDTFIVFMTFLKTFQYRSPHVAPLTALLYKDSLMYFSVLCCANIVNLVCVLKFEGSVSLFAGTFSNALTVSLTSRLFLRLRRQTVQRSECSESDHSIEDSEVSPMRSVLRDTIMGVVDVRLTSV